MLPSHAQQILVQIFLGLWLFISSSLNAEEIAPDKLRGVDNNRPVAVLQKRFFKKSLRPEIGLLFGKALDEAYTNTSLSGLRVGLFFSEWMGLEVQYIDTSVTQSEDRKALSNLVFLDPNDGETPVSPNPETNPINGAIDATFVVAPFYGKSNFFDQFIVYTDLYLSIGAGQVTTSQGDLTALILGLGQRFYITKSFSLRIDFRDRFYTEERAGSKTAKNALSFDFGASFFFL